MEIEVEQIMNSKNREMLKIPKLTSESIELTEKHNNTRKQDKCTKPRETGNK